DTASMDPIQQQQLRDQPAAAVPIIKVNSANSLQQQQFAIVNPSNKIHTFEAEGNITDSQLPLPLPLPQPQHRSQHEWLGQEQNNRGGRLTDVELPNSIQTSDRRIDIANLVDRVRVVQLEEEKKLKHQPQLQQAEQEPQSHTPLDTHPVVAEDSQYHHFHRHLVPPGGVDQDEIMVTNSDGEDQEKHHHRFHLSRHGSRSSHFSHGSNSTRAKSTTSSKKRAILFPKMLNKDSVLNAIATRRAANAFQEACRFENLSHSEISEPLMAVVGTAIPALFLRRDDKGRRPPPVLFNMIKLAVTDSEIDGVSNKIIFRVELAYGDVKWVIRRSLYEFYKLHLKLSAKRFEGIPKFPGQLSSYAFTVAKAVWSMKSEERVDYLRQNNLNRRELLQGYMCQLLQTVGFNSAYDLYEFLEISALSVTKGMGWKGKEGYLQTKVTETGRSFLGIKRSSRLEKNWVLLRDSYIAFTPTIGSDEPIDVFLFDKTFFVQQKESALGTNMHRIVFGDSSRKIEIKGDHTRKMIQWMYDFEKIRYFSPWVNAHRFGSFAPEREDAKIKMYVDGKDYFHAVSDALIAAKREIYICDWWLSPELYLRRPPEKNEEFRLDRLLKRKAMEGVMIYIVVYKEVSLALTLDSAHTKIWLQDLHPNIQVQRHPDHVGATTTQFWAHHEKICVIDCHLAFMGGLDLCFGRYDTRTHQLADYHPSGKGTIWPGQDYNNPRIKDFVNVKDYNTDLIDKRLLSRMPWHDVSLAAIGQPARDIARHFVQRWNFVKREKGMKKNHMKLLTPKGEFVSSTKESGWSGTQKVQILRSSSTWSQGVETESSIQDAYIVSILKAKHFIYIENQFFITLATENGNPDIKNRIGIALVDRILKAHREGTRFRVIVVMPLMPSFEADIMSSEAGTLRKVMHFQYMSICRGGHSIFERLLSHGLDPHDYIGFYGLRSFDRIKHGKFDAIVEAIKEAETAEKNPIGGAPDHSDKSTNALAQKIHKASTGILSTTTKHHHADHPEGLAPKGKSLATKFLLDDIPKGKDAERIKVLADRRRRLDVLKTWDESISKRAMNPAKQELGYVPATTNEALEDKEMTAKVARETREAEIKAIENGYRQTGRTSPEFMDGVGTMFRNAIERVKGTKDNGDLEPMHRRLREKSMDRIRSHTESIGSSMRQNFKDAIKGHGEEGISAADQDAINDTESIIEPGASHHHQNDFDDNDDDESSSTALGSSGSGEGPSSASVGAQSDTPAHGRHHYKRHNRHKQQEPIVDDEVDNFVTEQLYIHTKLMIVDDRIIICGSANLNDRSQLGYRDSEIAIYIEDTEMIQSTMNGKPYLAGKLAHELRTDLFKEHLGLLPHVDHDVITSASVLPVDLNSPGKDPEQKRLELIRKANERLQQQQQQGQQSTQATGSTMGNGEIYTLAKDEEIGGIKAYIPDEDEIKDVKSWNSTADVIHKDAKKLTAEDPSAADLIVRDPLHDDFYECWWKRVAATNTEVFREVFRCVPDNTVETWDQYKAFIPNSKKVLQGHVAMEGATVDSVNKRLQKITGHLVEFPLRFLIQENLIGTAESAVVPMEIFT
ncbi:hypothetical protein BGX27_001710, partial [Mortierella sp. AM989]